MSDYYKIAILDDEKFALNIISASIEDFFEEKGFLTKISKYTHPLFLKEDFNEKEFDVVFLDIEMNEIDGICLAEYIKNNNSKIDIVFVSNRADRVFETFDVSPFAFVRKSNLVNDLPKCLSRLLEKRKKAKNDDVLITKSRGALLCSNIDDIVYIESSGRIQTIVLQDGKKIECHESMKDLENKLINFGFYRAQRSFIINMKYINTFNVIAVMMKNGKEIVLKRGNYKDLKIKFLSFLQQNSVLL